GNDQRTSAECEEIEQAVGRERLLELTGNRALTGFTAPKLLWVRRHEPEVWQRAAHILLPKDYVRLRLTGERVIDAAEASGTLLFDVAGRRWSEEVCEALGIPGEWLPPVNESTATGGAGDQQAGAVGVGAVRPGVRPESARVSGGGARSELWLRSVASVLGIPLERTAVEEGAAYGAALLGGVAAGAFADVHEAGAASVRVRETVEPDPAWQAAYE